jgi:hypothetical protein
MLFPLLFILNVVLCEIQMQIIYTPIIHFLPYIKQHHIVLLSKKDTYAVDFTPVEERFKIWKLISGKNIKGEVRLRRIDREKIFSTLDKKCTEKESRTITLATYHSIKDSEMKTIIKKLFDWNEKKQMNLYTRNCQHFSEYTKHILS